MSFSSIKSHRKRKVNSSILIIILTLISRINSQSQFWSSNTFNNKHTTASKNPKLFQQQIQKFTSNPYYSQNQMQSKVVKMPHLNQKVFLGLRKPALVKHLEKRYGKRGKKSPENLDYVTFLTHLLEKYDHRIRPTTTPLRTSGNKGQKIPTFVLVDMYVNALGGISEVTMDYETNLFLRLTWFDNRLNFQQYYKIEELNVPIDMINKIWKPDPFFVNEKSARLHNVPQPTKYLRIRKDGRIQSG